MRDDGMKEVYRKEVYVELSRKEEEEDWSMEDGTFLKIQTLK